MNYPSNSAFNQTVKGLMIGASIVTQVSGSTEVEAGYYKSLSQYNMGSTKPREDYSPISKSSVQNVTIFSNQNAVMEYEKTIIFQEIHNKLQAKVKKHWIPNNILNEKTCLFDDFLDNSSIYVCFCCSF